VALYLLDSNDSMNSPVDRGITGELYGGDDEVRLMQEIALGVGGWRALEAMGLNVDVCHLNEGHAAFLVLERARRVREERDVSFRDTLCATRAGNVFTTHTPVVAGFDTFPPALIKRRSQLKLDAVLFPTDFSEASGCAGGVRATSLARAAPRCTWCRLSRTRPTLLSASPRGGSAWPTARRSRLRCSPGTSRVRSSAMRVSRVSGSSCWRRMGARG
jgi:hypothetical protein